MQQLNYIRAKTIEEVKRYVQTLCERKEPITVVTKKTRTKGIEHTAVIEGVYAKFCTVRDDKLKVAYTIQYIDILTGDIRIETPTTTA